jgi:uncharacterized protein
MTVNSYIAIRLISFYQRYISPRKGYACAYRALHNDLSCSAFCKKAIESHGIYQGVKHTLQRFHECYLAAQTIKKKREDMKEKPKGIVSKIGNECNKLGTCEQYILFELAAEAACCLCSGVS